jgi:hypothetical protein
MGNGSSFDPPRTQYLSLLNERVSLDGFKDLLQLQHVKSVQLEFTVIKFTQSWRTPFISQGSGDFMELYGK